MNIFNADEPYNKLPILPPASDIETKAILKQCIEAKASLARLKEVTMLPNQTVLINTLPLLGAQASSEIENIVTTTDKLFQFANTADIQFNMQIPQQKKH
jgi:Fic family protein